MTTRTGRAACWVLGLVAAGVVLRAAAVDDLAGPPVTSLDGLTAWVDAREPVAVTMALVRLLAEISVWYVLGLSVVHVLARALRLPGGHRLADAASAPGVGRIVKAGLGLGMVAASSMGGQDNGVGAPNGATMTPVADVPAVTPRRVDDARGTATMRPEVGPQPDVQPGGVAQMTPLPTTWTVAPGESFWSIAEELLADAWGRPPSDVEVDPFWRTLVERNRGRLIDPRDADLVQPGQVFEVPPLPARP